MARMRSEDRRRQLLEVSAELFAQSGYRGTTTAELAKALSCRTEKHERLLPVLYRRTQVGRRASVLAYKKTNGNRSFETFFSSANHENDQGPGTESRMGCYAEEAPALALQAAKNALNDAKAPLSDIGHLVTVSCTGFSAPGFDIGLIKGLGLPHDIQRTHVGFMGCHGAFNAFRVARAMVRENPEKKVLVCSVEICSIHFSYGWDPDRVVANALFADGASAAVFSIDQENTRKWELAETGSFLFPHSEDAMTWRIGNNGFEMSLSARVPGLIASDLRPWLSRWLKGKNLNLSKVRSWAVHPGGPRILNAVQASLGLPKEATRISRDVLADHGNMSSATILFILDRLYKEKAPTPCLALGFGPGLVCEAALFRS